MTFLVRRLYPGRALLCRLAAVLALVGPIRAQVPGSAPDQIFRDATFEQLAQLTVVSVSKSEEKYFGTAAAVHVITGDEIRRSGAMTLPDALRLAPGMEVGMVNSRTFAITMRGFNGTSANKLLPLIDGRSLYSLRFAGTIWDIRDLPLDDVAQIEVIGGPGGTTWGANAVNGVINVITKSARETLGTQVSTVAGTYQQGMLYARQGVALSPHSWVRVYVKAFARDDSEPVNVANNHDDWNQVRAGFRYDREDSEGNHTMATGGVFFSEGDQLVGGQPDIARSHGGNVLVRHRRTLGNGSSLQLQTYLDSYTRDSGGNFSKADTLDLDAVQEITAGERHNLTWGANFRRSRLEDTVNTPGFTSSFDPLVRNFNQGGIYAQDVFRPAPVTALTLGAKAEYNDFTRWEFMPSARLAYFPQSNVTVWLASSRAARIPSRFEHDQSLTLAVPGFTSLTLPSPRLRAEILQSYEAGVRWQLGREWTVDTAFYYNDYQRLVTNENAPTVSPVGTITTLANLGQGRGIGAELSAMWQPADWWRLQATYNVLDLDLSVDPSSLDTSLVLTTYQSPRWQAGLRSSWNLSRSWEADLDLRHVGALAQPGRGIPAYHTLDVRVGKQLGSGWELSLVGQNLLAPSHQEFRFFTIRAAVARGAYVRLDWRK